MSFYNQTQLKQKNHVITDTCNAIEKIYLLKTIRIMEAPMSLLFKNSIPSENYFFLISFRKKKNFVQCIPEKSKVFL